MIDICTTEVKSTAQEGFWESASTERNIGYNGAWYEYITDMLKKPLQVR